MGMADPRPICRKCGQPIDPKDYQARTEHDPEECIQNLRAELAASVPTPSDEEPIDVEFPSPKGRESIEEILTASDTLRFMFRMHGTKDQIRQVLGPANYDSALEYLEDIDVGARQARRQIDQLYEWLEEWQDWALKHLRARDLYPESLPDDTKARIELGEALERERASARKWCKLCGHPVHKSRHCDVENGDGEWCPCVGDES